MSPRAAWRLERLGYGPVYDYAWGKVDWLAAGLPTEGTGPRERRALDVLQPAMTCEPTATAGEAAERARAAGVRSVFVVNEHGVLLGRVDAERAAHPDDLVENVMAPGPTTVRAHEPLDPLLERMASRGITEMVVTTPEGRLLGVVRPPKSVS
jgi:CBS domain-containing protein